MTGALAVVAEEAYVVEVPERFRFSDENPLTLEPYARDKFGDLPPYVEDVITDVVGLSGAEWDALVDAGEVYSVVGPHRSYSLAGFLRSVRARSGRERAPKGVCADCLGTCAVRDWDASLTGRRDAVVLCSCATGAAEPVVPAPRGSGARVVFTGDWAARGSSVPGWGL